MKIFCIGMNYREHCREMNNPLPAEPVVFMKPDSAILRNNHPFFYPSFSTQVHYETELVLKICRVGKNIAGKYACRYYNEIGIGIDFTARDLQASLKEKGLPWEISKAFDQAAAIGKFFPKTDFADTADIRFHLDINGKTVQNGNSSDLIFSFDELIVYISRFFTLKMGDLIYTGTPSGVGPVNIGDHLQAFIGDRMAMDFKIK